MRTLVQFGPWIRIVLAVNLTWSVICVAQEVGFVDLTQVQARMQLRRPVPQNGEAVGSRGGITQFHECDPSTKDAGTARTSLVWLDRDEYAVGDQNKFEVRIENIGSVPIKVPFSPHLADLQPKDASQQFGFSELTVELWIAGGERWSSNTGGAIYLYGSGRHPGTILTMLPGEWVRIIGEGKFTPPDESVNLIRSTGVAVSQAYAQSSIYDAEELLTATSAATILHRVCLIQIQGPGVPMKLDAPK
jgi:hypothetical protein